MPAFVFLGCSSRIERALAATALLLATVSGCRREPQAVVSASGLRIERTETLIRPRAPGGIHALPGDWVLETPRLRVIVGGMGRSPAERGAILEARSRDLAGDESVTLLAPSVAIGSRRSGVVVTRIEARVRNRRPLLRIEGRIESDDGSKLGYSREITLSSGYDGIGLWSKVWPDRGSVDVRLGARIGWGGAEPWLPGVGPLSDEHWRSASFVGVEGRTTGTVYALRDGPVRVGAEYEIHGAARFLRHTEVMGAIQHSSRHAPAMERAILVIARRGLSEALRRFGWLRGAPFAEAYAYFPHAPPSAYARIATARGEPLLHVRADARGSAVIPLPPVLSAASASYVAVGTAPGHASGDPVSFVPRAKITLGIPRGGHVRITARDASTHEPIPARVRLLPVDGAPEPELGPVWSASGARDVVEMRDGTAIVPLPPGRYRVLVSHGPEWTLHDETVHVTEAYRPDVHAALVHVVDAGSWIACDLHVHAAPSPDSQVSLEDRVLSLVAEGIGFAVPTDHNHVTDYAPSARALAFDEHTFLTAPGVEATTWEPHFGHFNAYPVTLDEGAPNDGAPPWERQTPAELFHRMRELGQDVAIQVNHPRLEGEVGYFDRVGYDPATGHASGPYSSNYDVLEVWNGFDLGREEAFSRVFHDWIAMVARGRHVTGVGNSDSHTIRMEWAGYPRTYVRAADRTPVGIVHALREGHAFVSSGPFLEVRIGDAGPGDVVAATHGSVEVHVHVRTPPWMSVAHLEVWMNGRIVKETALTETAPATRRDRGHAHPQGVEPRTYDARLDVPVTRDAGIVVLVRGDATLDDYFGRAMIPPLAFSNPVWVDADGDGRGPRDPGDPAPSPGRWDAVRRSPAGDTHPGMVETRPRR